MPQIARGQEVANADANKTNDSNSTSKWRHLQNNDVRVSDHVPVELEQFITFNVSDDKRTHHVASEHLSYQHLVLN